MAAKSKATEISLIEVEYGQAVYCILGTSPLILNRVSQKAQRELLMPKGRKTAAEKASTLKHNPIAEFRESPYTFPDDDSPTLIYFPGGGFKKSMANAAKDLPGSSKAQIGRLINVVEWDIPIYGVPYLLMSVVRNSDMNRTPDVRTRAIIKEWAAFVTIRHAEPIIRDQTVANLLVGAGILSGLGDFRQEKGAGSYGAFTIVPEDDARFQRIVKTGGRKAQIEAMENPVCYDKESEDLLDWYNSELKIRGFTNGKATKEEAVV